VRSRRPSAELGDRLVQRGVIADIYVFGGAAMALAYDARRATRDIDAVFKPHGIVLEEARTVADELGLPDWWLNEQALAACRTTCRSDSCLLTRDCSASLRSH
jgi:hypothetical protein